MRNNKKLLLMAGVLSMTLLAGCGDAAEKDSDTKTETSADATESESAESADTESADAGESDTEASTETDADTEKDSTDADTEDDNTEAADEKTEDSSSDTFNTDTVSVAGWNFTVEDVQMNPSLENVSVEMGYTNVETTNFKKEASTGKTFCLIKLKIEKDGSKESIDWANMKVTDSDGNEYERMDDEFLTDLGMMRMPGNTLNFGTNEGWIVYEVNEDAEGLELTYSFDSEEYNCTL